MKSSKMLVLVLSLTAGVALVWRFWNVAMPFFVAAIFAYLLGPLVNRLCRRGRMKRGLAVAIVLVVFVALIVLLLWWTIPYAINQVGSLVHDISSYASSLDELSDKVMKLLSDLHMPQIVLTKAGEILSQADVYLTKLFKAILEWLVNFSAGLFDVVVVFILIIYFLLDGRRLIHLGLSKLPVEMSARMTRVLQQADTLTWKYVRSRVLISGGMAIVTYIGLRIMGIEYAAVFAVLSFVLDFIPYFGSLLAGVIEAVYALVTGGLGLAIAVAVFVLVVQQIEGNIVAPKVQADAVGIHPITVLFALLACSEIWGPIGMLISTPVAGICKIVFGEVYRYLTAGLPTPESVAAAKAAAAPPPPAGGTAAPAAEAAPEKPAAASEKPAK